MLISRPSLSGLGSSTVETIASVITRIEGARPGTNNPGNLMDLPYYQSTGQFRIATYPTLAAGQQALYAQIQRNLDKGLTLYEFFGGKPGVYGGYAPQGHGGNDPRAYANQVAAALGVDPDEVITGDGSTWPTGGVDPLPGSSGDGDDDEPGIPAVAVVAGVAALLALVYLS